MLTDKTGLYWKVKELAHNLGFADFGSANIGPVSEISRTGYMDSMDSGYFAGMEYLHKNVEKRFNPGLLVEGAATIMVFLAPYSLPDSFIPPKGVSQYALGEDYHKVIKGKLFTIMQMIGQECPNFNGRAFTDSAPVLEREWGVRAGLGFIGKNNFLISKNCGIKNFIGCIICNAEIPPTLEMEPGKANSNIGSCGECTLCLDACPTGALHLCHKIDARKCISYHTIENRNLANDIALGTVPDLSGQYFGCDRCLNACPWNSKNHPGWTGFHTNLELLQNASPEWWETLTQTEFKKIFKDSPLLRGGLEKIQTAILHGSKHKDNG